MKKTPAMKLMELTSEMDDHARHLVVALLTTKENDTRALIASAIESYHPEAGRRAKAVSGKRPTRPTTTKSRNGHMSTAEVAKMLDITPSALRQRVAAGSFPEHSKKEGQKLYWRTSKVERWCEKNLETAE